MSASQNGNPLLLTYPIVVERGALDRLASHVVDAAPAHRYALIADATVAQFHGDRVRAGFPADRTTLLTVPPGEREKSREQWAALTDALLAWGAGRDTTIVAIGGGVVGDLAGFVAATFMRGVSVVQVPTTLLAMVDASVGGKTAVDTPAGKNLVGAFHDPRAVIVDPDVLTTLPQSVFRSGLAEMLKHGIIADPVYFGAMELALANLASEYGARTESLPSLIAGSIAIKAAIVAADARESGRRQVLNFGHTIAHAVEQQAAYSMLHGNAVAIGMVVEATIAESLGLAQPGLSDLIAKVVHHAGLPFQVPAEHDVDALVVATHGDKKSRGGEAHYALPTAIGTMAPGNGSWAVPVTDAVARQAILARRG